MCDTSMVAAGLAYLGVPAATVDMMRRFSDSSHRSKHVSPAGRGRGQGAACVNSAQHMVTMGRTKAVGGAWVSASADERDGHVSKVEHARKVQHALACGVNTRCQLWILTDDLHAATVCHDAPGTGTGRAATHSLHCSGVLLLDGGADAVS